MNYVSLFSSAGVGCYGFKKAGFKCAATSELIERRLNIQKLNHKALYDESYVLGDITKFETKKMLYHSVNNYLFKENEKNIDAVIFTAPCQGMSVANHKKNDGTIERNSLVIEALEIVKKLKPNFFIAENVRSFMNTTCIDHDKSLKIEEAFENWLGDEYNYLTKVINFKDYGANSSRTRTLVIGARKDRFEENIIEYLFPDKEKPKSLREVIGELPSLKNMGDIYSKDFYHNFKPYREDMRDWIAPLKEGENAFDNIKPSQRPHKIVNGERVFNVNKNGDKYRRQNWDKVAPCVHTRNDIISSQNTIHPNDDRVFSIRELMLMMNIPRDFRWIADYSLDQLNKLSDDSKKKLLKENEINIRQSIGEAVPTIIMEKIARRIKEVLENGKLIQKNKNYNKQLQFNL
ncbi:DNA cytosine methyltransferase [Staphylococcus pasteuri]|uniref:DNA cytosine methyltransferase n=1 Tax=Staphylococcus pasteuri TaxID=45972 RepID=UPI002DBA372C|nr:DNA cytosine methyltransferase [Staphylococcus pasteuri]MEB7434850.1 DNA cytosine methyltransferase [Staphylococcus pasteuri]